MSEGVLQTAEKRREVKGKGERERYTQLRASMVAQMIKNLPAMQETWIRSLGWEDPLEEGMATDCSILAWRIPWTEEPGGLWSSVPKSGHD